MNWMCVVVAVLVLTCQVKANDKDPIKITVDEIKKKLLSIEELSESEFKKRFLENEEITVDLRSVFQLPVEFEPYSLEELLKNEKFQNGDMKFINRLKDEINKFRLELKDVKGKKSPGPLKLNKQFIESKPFSYKKGLNAEVVDREVDTLKQLILELERLRTLKDMRGVTFLKLPIFQSLKTIINMINTLYLDEDSTSQRECIVPVLNSLQNLAMKIVKKLSAQSKHSKLAFGVFHEEYLGISKCVKN